MRAEIVSVGTELLLGHIVDTNAAFLAQELSALGIDLFWVSTVGDNQGRLAEVLERALGRSDLTIITGGIGPTEDDCSREAIAQCLGETMKVDPELERELRAFFARRNRPMPERNVKQATLIPSAQTLPNPVGTAPGWFVESKAHAGHLIVTMPGVPSEMYKMWREQVVPRLLARERSSLQTRILKVLGIGESHVEEMIQAHLASTNPTIATYAKNDGVHVRISAKAPDAEAARALLAPMEADVRRILGPNVWGEDDETMEGIVGGLLRKHGLTLATFEGLTGGLVASALFDATDSAVFYQGGLVGETPAQLLRLGVEAADGATSSDAARAMARAARERLGADVGLAVCGIGVANHESGQPRGMLHIAVDDRGETLVESGIGFGNTRPQIKARAALAALDLLRRYLQGTH